jgi:hypothetical protein
MSELAYKHEIGAEFGEQEEGVFQNAYVQAARADYRYGQLAYNPSWMYTIGVDWNDTKIGTTIAVLGFNPITGIFTLVDKATVSRDGWTQLAACEKIAAYNRIWNPVAIYVDHGYNSMQTEVLHQYGHRALIDPAKGPSHPDSRLRNIVKNYDFGSALEVHDLWTHQPIKKAAKPFLVESASRRFEQHDIRFSKYDESLEKQLLGYVVARVTPTGIPVYEASNENVGDHMLDALMLAIVGFILEKTVLGKPKYDIGIAFAGRIGENREPEIFQGDLVIKNQKPEDTRDHSRPNTDRTAGVGGGKLLPITGELPANHANESGQVGLWDWPGFSRDSPKPKLLTLSESENAAKKRLGLWKPRSAIKPRRKNI